MCVCVCVAKACGRCEGEYWCCGLWCMEGKMRWCEGLQSMLQVR